MTPEQYQHIRELFLAVREKDPAQRADYLRRACQNDEVRAEVESLLANDEKADTFLQTPVLGEGFAVGTPESLAGTPRAAAAQPRSAADEPDRLSGARPTRVGQYRILDVLGEGGMGVVYRAEQENPRRTVALKVIKPGIESREALKRFEHEGQVLGRLQHPGIAQVFEAGTARIETERGLAIEQPFFAMEYVRGQPLNEYARGRHLSTRQRLELLAKVCDAVHHAHQKGVIHRDLKPRNILVDDFGQPKVLDFGVARVVDADVQMTTLQTDVGQLIGTLAYMSPEQVAGDGRDLDTRSDVYALGMVGYELLAGRLPYDVRGRTIAQVGRTIAEVDPAPLGSISRVFRGDPETIFAKALEKDRTRRYQSASDLAADIRRCLADEPISAHPVTTFYQLRKFAKRNRVLVTSLTGIVLALIAGTVVSTCLAVWALRAEELARERYDQAEQARRLAERRRSEAADALATATTETARATAVRDFLVRMLGHVNPDVALGRDVTLLRAVLDAAADDIQTDLAAYPDVQATIHHVIGTVYRNISRYAEAEHHLQAACDLRDAGRGPDHADTLASRGALAQLRWDQGRLDEAETMYASLVADYQRTLGAAHRDTLITRYCLAGVVKDSGRLDQAEEQLRDLLTAMQTHLDAEDDAVIDAMNGLALLSHERGRFEEAERLLRTVVQHWTDVRELQHPKRARALMNLTVIVKKRGDLAQAEQLARETLELDRAVFGEDHHDTIKMRINLVDILRERGQLPEAETLAREVHEQASRVLGPEHPDTLKAISHLGIILRLADKFDEAEEYLTQAVALSEKLHGPHDPRTLNGLSSLAGLYFEQQKLAETEAIMRRVVDGLRATRGERAFATLAAMNNLGTLLVERGKLADAEQILQTTIRLVDEAAPPDHWFRWTARVPYGQCLLEMRRFEQAEQLLLECFTKLSDALGPKHYRTRGAAETLVALYEAWGRPADAAGFREPAASQPASPDVQGP